MRVLSEYQWGMFPHTDLDLRSVLQEKKKMLHLNGVSEYKVVRSFGLLQYAHKNKDCHWVCVCVCVCVPISHRKMTHCCHGESGAVRLEGFSEPCKTHSQTRAHSHAQLHFQYTSLFVKLVNLQESPTVPPAQRPACNLHVIRNREAELAEYYSNTGNEHLL